MDADNVGISLWPVAETGSMQIENENEQHIGAFALRFIASFHSHQ